MPTQSRGLIWSDEFEGTSGAAPDPTCWRHEIGGGGWGNAELQSYTGSSRNAFQDGNGCLVIRARQDANEFTSARLTTKGLKQFTYGRLECRARLPNGGGLWSAFWALGANIDAVSWPACGEIDVMENLGHEPHRVFGTVHCPGHCGRSGIVGDLRMGSSLHQNFHVFAVDWTVERIVWRVDNVPYHSVERTECGDAWVFDHPFYLMINLAVGGTLGGKVAGETKFPADLLVDYVRIFNVESAPYDLSSEDL